MHYDIVISAAQEYIGIRIIAFSGTIRAQEYCLTVFSGTIREP